MTNKHELKIGQVVEVNLSGDTFLGIVDRIDSPTLQEEDVSVLFINTLPDTCIKPGTTYLVDISNISIF